jgi:hypothetical protein
MRKLIMSRKEMEQIKVFERLKRNEITQVLASHLLKVSTRWVRKKFKRYLAQGDKGILHLGRGKPSTRRWNEDEKARVIQLVRNEWQGFGPTFAAEKLATTHQIKISDETLRQVMIKEGLWQKKRKRSSHRMRRERKRCFGLMVQLDGSPHDWFEGRAGRCTLLVFIDDATSTIIWLEFAHGESVEAIMGAMKGYFQQYGRPHAFYVDFGSVFSVNTNNTERDKITQFERACKELDIAVIHATSPQAKGRVERCNRTLQDRLIKEMRLARISSIDAANCFAREIFIPDHNKRFAVQPAQDGDGHRSLDGYDLNRILCIKDKRVIQNDFIVQYNGVLLQLVKHQQAVIRPKETVDVFRYFDGSLELFIRGIKLNAITIAKRPERPEKEPITPTSLEKGLQ